MHRRADRVLEDRERTRDVIAELVREMLRQVAMCVTVAGDLVTGRCERRQFVANGRRGFGAALLPLTAARLPERNSVSDEFGQKWTTPILGVQRRIDWRARRNRLTGTPVSATGARG